MTAKKQLKTYKIEYDPKVTHTVMIVMYARHRRIVKQIINR